MEKINRNKFVSSAIWKFLEALGTKGASVIISIVLARMLLPEAYGIVGITDIFVNFSVILVQSGINTSLIRKEKVDDQDYSNAFFFSLAIAALCYTVFYFASPAIANFYNEPQVTTVLRVQMISLFLCSLGTVRNAIIVREFKFKQLCLINLVSTIIGGAVGIYVAFKGGGVWALVFYTLVRDGVNAIILFFFVRWKLIFKISIPKLKALVSFSIWVLFSTLLDFFGNNIYGILIGKYYNMADLGYYNKGGQLSQIVCLYIFGAITSVLLPALSQVQNDLLKLKSMIKKVTRMSAYVIYPMMIGLAVVGERLIPVLFSDRWIPSVPIHVASCLIFAVNPCRSINIQVLYAKGQSRNVMIIEIIRFALLILGLVAGVQFFNVSVVGLAYIQMAIAFINTFITQLFVRKAADYSVWEWLKDQSSAIIMSIIMGALVILIGKIPIPSRIICLAMQVVCGAGAYLALSLLTHVPEFTDIKIMIKEKTRGHKA